MLDDGYWCVGELGVVDLVYELGDGDGIWVFFFVEVLSCLCGAY